LEALRNNGGGVHLSAAALAGDSCIFKDVSPRQWSKIEGIKCAQAQRSSPPGAACDDGQKDRP